MKTKFFLLFLCIPVLAYSQATKSFNLNGSRFGVVYTPPSGYGFQGSSSLIYVGKVATNQTTIGRGYLEFDLSTLTTEIINDMTKAELVFTCGLSINNNSNKHTVNVKRLIIPGYGDDLHSQPDYAFAELNSTYNDFPDTVNLKQMTSNRIKAIDKNLISLSYSSNPNLSSKLRLCLVHTNEGNDGIYLTNAKLVITYHIIPDTPTGLRVVDNSITQVGCQLAWNASTGATSYEVNVYNSGGTLVKTVPVASTSTTITGLAGGTSYTACVKAKSPKGTSACNAPVPFTTLPSPSIYGPNEVCWDGSGFTLRGGPANNITWTVTGPFSFSNIYLNQTTTSNILITVYKSYGSAATTGTLTAKSGSTVLASKTITPCSPPQLSFIISGPYEISPGNTYGFSIGSVHGIMQQYLIGYHWQWYVAETSGWKFYAEKFGAAQSVNLYFPNVTYAGERYIQLKCVVENKTTRQTFTAYYEGQDGNGLLCWSCDFDYNYSSSSSSIAYPNPVSNILNVDLGRTATQANALESITSGKQLKQETAYDVRLYDGQGNLLRHAKAKGGNVEFNVQNLSNGVYFLHIYDGVSEKPRMQQIVVEH